MLRERLAPLEGDGPVKAEGRRGGEDGPQQGIQSSLSYAEAVQSPQDKQSGNENEMVGTRVKIENAMEEEEKVPANPILTDKEVRLIRQKYMRALPVENLFAVPSLPLQGGAAQALVRLHRGIKRNVRMCREGAGDMSAYTWVRG